MQFLWRYVDELVGKGFTIGVLGQFFYLSALSLLSQALPLSILLAALMTFGNFGERYELLAMKAAGIPLLRVMAPLIAFVFGLSCLSFYFQNVTAPDAQVRLYTLIFSMKQKSPELEIPEGVFYDEIEGYNLYVKHKDRKTGMLYDVMIYNFSDGFENAHILVSDSGKLQSSADKHHLVLSLYSGEQFENLRSQEMNQRNVPYRRESFREKEIIIDFDANFNMMDGGFLNKQAASKNMSELKHSADSMRLRMDSIGRLYYKSAMKSSFQAVELSKVDSVDLMETPVTAINIDSILQSSTRQQQQKWTKAALSKVETGKTDFKVKAQIVYDNDKNIRKHQIEWWNKISLSLSCLVFFFIGAPLGAIIRKGGLGFPVVISVITFIIYYIFNTSGYKMAREGEWAVWFGCWVSTLVLLPVGAFFTYKANKDSIVFNIDAYTRFFRMLLGLRTSRSIFRKEVIIDDPNYEIINTALENLCNESEEYLKSNRLSRSPNYIRIFMVNKQDMKMTEIRNHLEIIVEELGNSRERKILNLLNTFPVPAVNAHKSPFAKRWLNLLVGIVFPVGIFFYIRIWRFGKRLDGDLRQIIETSRMLQEVIATEKLTAKKYQ